MEQCLRSQKGAVLDRPLRVLDLATGTADIALVVADYDKDARVLGVDPSMGMLKHGAEKVKQHEGFGERVRT